MSRLEEYETVLRLAKELVKAEKDSLRACEQMRQLDVNASKARRVAANNKWSNCAEHRDEIKFLLHLAAVDAGVANIFDEGYYDDAIIDTGWHKTIQARRKPTIEKNSTVHSSVKDCLTTDKLTPSKEQL